MGFGAAPVCSETFTMAEDPKASAVGEKTGDETSDGDHDWTAIMSSVISAAAETGHAERFQRALRDCSTPLGRKLHSSQLANSWNRLWSIMIK